MKTQRGFTLIELLVVIAIIGILSAVVLASLNTARSKGNDAAVMSNIDGIRTQAGVYSSTNGSYGSNAAEESNCAATDNLFNDPTVVNQVAAAAKANNGGTITCNVDVKVDAVEWQVLLNVGRVEADSPQLNGAMALNVSSPSSDAGAMWQIAQRGTRPRSA